MSLQCRRCRGKGELEKPEHRVAFYPTFHRERGAKMKYFAVAFAHGDIKLSFMTG
jgi:hypothetical protein